MLVHHLRKNAAAALGGQALRQSGDLHAWGDSNLYLRRSDGHVSVSIEHRAAPAPEPIRPVLKEEPLPHLTVVGRDDSAGAQRAETLAERVLALIARGNHPLSRDRIRGELKVRNATVGQVLERLVNDGLISVGQRVSP